MLVVGCLWGAGLGFAQDSDKAAEVIVTDPSAYVTADASVAVAPGEQPALSQAPSQPVELTGDSIEYKAEEGKFVASGNVFLKQNSTSLYCDRLEFYRDKKEAQASGNVVLESDQGTVWADKAFYNFDTKRGDFTRARVMAKPIFGYATHIIKVRENYYILSDGWLSTSDYDDPEYKIRSNKIELMLGDKAVATGSTMILGGVPVMYLPKYTQDLRDNKPHIRVIPGYKKEFGGYLLTSYRVRPTEKIETTYHMDYRELKDLAWGVDVKYDPTAIGQGLIRTYYTNERTVHAGRLWDKHTPPTTELERYRVEWRHKLDIDPTTSFIAQYYKLSDNTFLKEYFEKEYRADSSPETFALLSKSYERAMASVRVDARANRFDSTVQRLPEVNLTFNNQPIADTGFYFKSSNTAVNLTKEEAVPSDNQNHTMRFDTDNEVSRPFKVSFLEFRPFAGTEQTYYSRTLNKGDYNSVRGIFRTGTDVSTKFYRVYDVNYNKYGIELNKLRHVWTPTVAYLYQHAPTVGSDKLFNYDATDVKHTLHRFSPGLGSVFQTKRNGQSVDILRSLLSTDYYMSDNKEINGLLNRRGGWGDVKLDNELYVNKYVVFHQDATYSNEERHIQTVNADLYIRDDKKWEFDIGRRYTYQDDDLLTTQWSYIFNPKWRTVIYDQWNIATGDWKEQQYAVVRDLHSWEVEFAFKNKNDYDENSSEVWVIFRLKAFPSVTFDGGSSLSKSKPGAQNNN